MGIFYSKNSSLNNSEQLITNETCSECRKGKIELRMYQVGIKLCRKCYLKRKNECYRRDKEFSGTSQINEITPKIYLGNNEGAKQKETLQQLGITHILVCGYYLHEYYPNDFTYMTVELEDNSNENLYLYLLNCIEFMKKASKVYVHCRAGISRSSSLVLGYLMLEDKMSYNQAKDYVLTKREVIQPNANFENQLMEFEEIIKGCNYNTYIINGYFKSFKENRKIKISDEKIDSQIIEC